MRCASYQFTASQIQIHPSLTCLEILKQAPGNMSCLPAVFVNRALEEHGQRLDLLQLVWSSFQGPEGSLTGFALQGVSPAPQLAASWGKALVHQDSGTSVLLCSPGCRPSLPTPDLGLQQWVPSSKFLVYSLDILYLKLEVVASSCVMIPVTLKVPFYLIQVTAFYCLTILYVKFSLLQLQSGF